MKKRIEFSWNANDFGALLKTCLTDDVVRLSMNYLQSKKLKILEAGCGLGRVVKYLDDLGYQNVYGIELNKAAVEFTKRKFPVLKVIQGDILKMPYKRNCFDVVLSYGVVEHFVEGLEKPLAAIHNVLKPGGLAIISVPSHNIMRQLLAGLFWSHTSEYRYYKHPSEGEFFEYRLTKNEFENACLKAKFIIVESLPVSHLDGFYHIFGERFVMFKNWQFRTNAVIWAVNKLLTRIPFFHNHMHVCVLRKK